MFSRGGRGGGPSRSTPANVQCQKCLKRDMYPTSRAQGTETNYPSTSLYVRMQSSGSRASLCFSPVEVSAAPQPQAYAQAHQRHPKPAGEEVSQSWDRPILGHIADVFVEKVLPMRSLPRSRRRGPESESLRIVKTSSLSRYQSAGDQSLPSPSQPSQPMRPGPGLQQKKGPGLRSQAGAVRLQNSKATKKGCHVVEATAVLCLHLVGSRVLYLVTVDHLEEIGVYSPTGTGM